MRQQINLYQPIFSEPRKPLSSHMVGFAFLAVIAGLVGYSVYASTKVSALALDIDALRAQQAQQEQLQSTDDGVAAREQPAVVKARIADLENMLTGRRAALELLQSGAAGQTTGFASRLEALARRHVEGLWIDKLVLSGTNGSMTLGGATLDADTVPAYLRSLANEQVLSGTRFDEFVIERPKQIDEPALAASEAEDKPVKKTVAPAHIRFRAASKALAPARDDATESAT